MAKDLAPCVCLPLYKWVCCTKSNVSVCRLKGFGAWGLNTFVLTGCVVLCSARFAAGDGLFKQVPSHCAPAFRGAFICGGKCGFMIPDT
eukprot:scaffold213078_cov16-Tisochrysis_lutea.AAC.1